MSRSPSRAAYKQQLRPLPPLTSTHLPPAVLWGPLSGVGQTLTHGLAPHGPFPGSLAQAVQGLESVPSTGDTGMSKGPALHLPTPAPEG